MKIKLKTGFATNQYHLVDIQDAHKAYFLFLNPTARTVFSNGLAITGREIISIEPSYQSAMGWNQEHKLENDDWIDIKRSGVDRLFQDKMAIAKEIAYNIENNKQLLSANLDDAITYLQESNQLKLN